MLTLLLILSAALCDRVRGGFPDDIDFHGGKPKWISIAQTAIKFSYGAILAALLTDQLWLIAMAGMTWKFGEQLAGDFGGSFRLIAGADDWWWPLIRIGLMWPLLTLPIAYWDWHLLLLLPASIGGVFLSALLAKTLPLPLTNYFDLWTRAPWQELIRGALIATFCTVLLWLAP